MSKRTTKKHKTKKYRRKTLRNRSKIAPKEDQIMIESARVSVDNNIVKNAAQRVVDNPSSRNMMHFTKLLTVSMKNAAVSKKSYTPSVNKKLESIHTNKGIVDIFGCGVESILGKTRVTSLFKVKIGTNPDGTPKCVSATSEEARKVMLKNFKSKHRLKCHSVIAPFQSHSNCWFNTMFMCFFVSDKGRKFMRFFRQAMIKGETLSGKLITPTELRNTLLLFNAAIEACYNFDGNASSIGLALNTNNIIGNIYKTIGTEEGIKDIDEYGNPYKFYRDLIRYLGNGEIKIVKLDETHEVTTFFSGSGKGSNPPDLVIATIADYDGVAQAAEYSDKPKKVNYKGATYVLDSVITRDVSKEHFCCGITCNGTTMLFDGSAFSRLESKDWKSLLNKDQDWKPTGSSKDWNFMQGYSMLMYYRES